MIVMKLIDTNVFVDYLRNHAPAIKFFESLQAKEAVFSAITEAELVAGKDCSDRRKKELTLHFIHQWEKILVSNPIAILAGDLVRENGLALPDALIAATAVLSNAELVTRNVKHFQKVPGLKVKEPY